MKYQHVFGKSEQSLIKHRYLSETLAPWLAAGVFVACLVRIYLETA